MSTRSTLAAGSAAAVVTALLFWVPATASAAPARDTDHDGMPDRYERAHGLDPRDARDARRDRDRDGLRNVAEYRAGTALGRADSDRDGDDDGDEVHDHSTSTDPTDPDTDDDGTLDGDEDGDHDGVANEDEDDASESCSGDDSDGDHDHVSDEDENELGLDRSSADTDGDTVPDGEELTAGEDVANEDLDDHGGDACTHDDDGDGEDDEDHGDFLGTIAAYDASTGDLTITTESGTDLVVVVTEDTEIQFEAPGDDVRDHGGSGDDGSDDGDDDGSDDGGHHGGGSDDPRGARGHGDDGDDGDDESAATTADLQPGVLVAELKFSHDATVLREVELYPVAG